MQKRYSWHKVSFFLPLIVVIILSICDGINPWGDRCLLHIDMYHQYCPFYVEMLHKLKEGGSFFYTWRQGLGADFVAMYAYYLASPLNLFLLIWPEKYVIEFMELMTWLKISGASLGAFVLIRGHFGITYGEERNPKMYLAVACGMAYALSGYMAAYSWDVMWLDTIMLAPFAIRGLELLISEKKCTMYYVALALAIWSNYYIAMMLCGFLVLYYIGYVATQDLPWKDAIGAGFRFALYSLLAGGSTMVLLIPEYIMMHYTGASKSTFPEHMKWYFNLVTELGRGTTSASIYTGIDHYPNIYAGAFVLVLMWMFALNNKIGIRKRIVGAIGVAFFLASFANNFLDYIWHGFHFPNSLPSRQSYLYIMLILLLSFEVLEAWDGVKLWHVILAGGIAAGFLIAGGITTDAEITEPFAFIFTGLFVLIYLLLMVIKLLTGDQFRERIVMAAALIAVSEIIANFAVTGFYTFSRSSYVAKQEDYKNLIAIATEREDALFEANTGIDLGKKHAMFRMEDPRRMTKNDNTLYGYASASTFSSNCNYKVSEFYQHMYLEGGTNFYCFNGSTPLMDAMLGVKYWIFDNEKEETAYRTIVGQSGKYYLYENTLTLPMGYVIPEKLASEWPNKPTTRIENINAVAKGLGASEDLLMYDTSVIQVVNPGSTKIVVDAPGIYYLSYKSCDADSLTIKVGERSRTFSKTTHRYLLDAGYCDAGAELEVTNSTEHSVEFYCYRLSDQALTRAYETLASQTLQVTKLTDTRIEGTIDVRKEGRLVFPITAEKGWTIRVDGEVCPCEAVDSTLLGVVITEGNHTITLTYETPGIRLGAGISLACIALAAFLLVLEQRKLHGKQ